MRDEMCIQDPPSPFGFPGSIFSFLPSLSLARMPIHPLTRNAHTDTGVCMARSYADYEQEFVSLLRAAEDAHDRTRAPRTQNSSASKAGGDGTRCDVGGNASGEEDTSPR